MKRFLNKWFILVALTLAAFFVFLWFLADSRYDAGYQDGQADFQPQVITQTIEVPVEKIVIEYQDREVIKVVEKPIYIDREVKVFYPVEKIVEKVAYKPTTDFQSLAEFQQFVDSIGIVIIVDWDKGFSTTDKSTGKCYDAALYYWQRAWEQGKRVYLDSVAPIEYNQFFTKRQQPSYEGHMLISVAIGRELYWLDPSTAEIVWRAHLTE